MSRDAYERFAASEMWCLTCKRAQPVREHLLLVLPSGNRYALRCAVCGAAVGERSDDDRSEFSRTLLGRPQG
jgi:hypothetical protein